MHRNNPFACHTRWPFLKVTSFILNNHFTHHAYTEEMSLVPMLQFLTVWPNKHELHPATTADLFFNVPDTNSSTGSRTPTSTLSLWLCTLMLHRLLYKPLKPYNILQYLYHFVGLKIIIFFAFLPQNMLASENFQEKCTKQHIQEKCTKQHNRSSQ